MRLPRFVPTRRLAALVALLAPVWLVSFMTAGGALAAAVVVLVLAVVIGDLLLAPGEHELTVERHAPSTIGIGDRATGEYHVRITRTDGTHRDIHVALYDALPSAVEQHRESHAITLHARGTSAVIPFELTGRVRGAYALGPVVLRASGPLGLVQRALRYALDDRVTITPSIAGVRHFRLMSLQHRLRDAGVRTIRRRGEGMSFTNLREYVVGDDPRHIDWKATARRHQLITREFAVEQGQTVMIAVDAGRMMTQLAGDLPRFEYALSSALVLADVALHSGDQVGLIVFDDEVRAFVPAQRGAATLRSLRDALVPVAPSMAEPDYAAAFRTLATRHRKRSLIVLFTDVIDPRASQALIAHTARTAARHVPLVVALRNEVLAHAATPPSEPDTEQLYQSAAAEELLLARHEALVRMRSAGVAVLDVPPHAMTAAVVNHYLEIKGRSAL
ncbi:MAG TPA: DUF58 domain-containing protein [Gemmatimonadaceae bacterium]|nr:DUF58 domain-containing protein [Gemmatimonadaceae bacterium]